MKLTSAGTNTIHTEVIIVEEEVCSIVARYSLVVSIYAYPSLKLTNEPYPTTLPI